VLIATDRLVLRRFRDDDAPTLAAYRSDEAVARYQSWQPPVPIADARRLVREMAAGDPDEPGWFQYAIERAADGAHLGDVGVNLHVNRLQAEIGFTVAGGYQGRGYATEAVLAVLRHLFDDRGLHRVSAECDARNVRSARLLERVGFRREGLRPAHTWLKGEWTDDLLFGLLARDWAARHRP
jgi:aminoglycoside 6'-N-acetyltransferase